MKHYILVLFVMLVTLSSCKIGCKIEEAVNASLPVLIASQLKCTNLSQIQSDIKRLLDNTNLCQATDGKTGPIAMIACPFVARAAVGYLGSKIPANWQCDPTALETKVEIAIIAACELIPF